MSNSTLSDLQFDASKQMLNFTASGAPGTVGFTSIVISKSYFNGPPMLLVDNGRTSPLLFSVTSNSTHYFLALIYPHSTHSISIGGGSPMPEFQGDLMQIALALASVLLLFKVRRGRRPSGRLKD